MRVRWWQSIRWRLALVSLLVVLLATALLAVKVILAINYYYGVELRQRLTTIADGTAQRIGVSDGQTATLAAAVNSVLPSTPSQSTQNQDYLLLILNMNRPPQLVYPRYGNVVRGPTFTSLLEAVADPSVRGGDFTKISRAVVNALQY